MILTRDLKGFGKRDDRKLPKTNINSKGIVCFICNILFDNSELLMLNILEIKRHKFELFLF